MAAYADACRARARLCLRWRSPDLCPLDCPEGMVYEACQSGCEPTCDPDSNDNNNGNININNNNGNINNNNGNINNNNASSSCEGAPREGCFCPEGFRNRGGLCVYPGDCDTCKDHKGLRHQRGEVWLDPENPCSLCTCGQHGRVQCSVRQCPTPTAPPSCPPCEVPRERLSSDKCCPEIECVCEEASCERVAVPRCGPGLLAERLNHSACQPAYHCVCHPEACPLPPQCPPGRFLSVSEGPCCRDFSCDCRPCSGVGGGGGGGTAPPVPSPAAPPPPPCPPGTRARTAVDECGCEETECHPHGEVCVDSGVERALGERWSRNCSDCSCRAEGATRGPAAVRCVPRSCERRCPPGHVFVPAPDGCCGACELTSCVVQSGTSRGDEVATTSVYRLGEEWPVPGAPCSRYRCERDPLAVGGGPAPRRVNVTCGPPAVPDSCPPGTRLDCAQLRRCCPACQCVAADFCVHNGTTMVKVGESLLLDECQRCSCEKTRDDLGPGFTLTCRRTRCPVCPQGYEAVKPAGSCCGTCTPTACLIRLNNGSSTWLKVNGSLTVGCETFQCRLVEGGSLGWQRRSTVCPPLQRDACIAQGGQIQQMEGTCCEHCSVKEEECKKVQGRLKFLTIGDCSTLAPTPISYCEGRCSTQAIYSVHTQSVTGACRCCAAASTRARPVLLACANGSSVQHDVLDAVECTCEERTCGE